MSNTNSDVQEFEVLGLKLRFRPDQDNCQVSAEMIVNYVKDEIKKLKLSHPQLKSGELGILLALKMAEEKLSLEKEYRENIEKLHAEAVDAMKVIDHISF